MPSLIDALLSLKARSGFRRTRRNKQSIFPDTETLSGTLDAPLGEQPTGNEPTGRGAIAELLSGQGGGPDGGGGGIGIAKTTTAQGPFEVGEPIPDPVTSLGLSGSPSAGLVHEGGFLGAPTAPKFPTQSLPEVGASMSPMNSGGPGTIGSSEGGTGETGRDEMGPLISALLGEDPTLSPDNEDLALVGPLVQAILRKQGRNVDGRTIFDMVNAMSEKFAFGLRDFPSALESLNPGASTDLARSPGAVTDDPR